jgi:hypothetical protein
MSYVEEHVEPMASYVAMCERDCDMYGGPACIARMAYGKQVALQAGSCSSEDAGLHTSRVVSFRGDL